MANQNVLELQQRLEHLDEIEKQMNAIIEDFMASPEEVDNAQEALNAINAERVEIKAMQAGGEVFADGCDLDKQYADPEGNTVVDNGQGYMEPDITSQSCEPGPVADKVNQKPVKKQESKDKEVKSESQESSSTPGYNARETPKGTVFVVGPTPPKYGYAKMPDYANLFEFAKSRGMKEKDFKTVWENMHELIAFEPRANGMSVADHYTIVKMKVYEAVEAWTANPEQAKEMRQEEDQMSVRLLETTKKVLKAEGVPERFAERVLKKVLSVQKVQSEPLEPALHIEAKKVVELLLSMGESIPATEEELTTYTDKYLSINDRVERIRAQAERMIAREKALLEAADDYLNPELVSVVETKLKESNKKVKFLDLATGRLQLKTYGSKFGIGDKTRLETYFKQLSAEALQKLEVERIVSYKYDQKVICEMVSDENCALFPMSAFKTTEPTTKCYVQSPKSKD